MILYNEKINGSKYPLVFLKTDEGNRIPQIVSTVVENNAEIPEHKNGICHVTATVLCTNGKVKGSDRCFLLKSTLHLPSGEALPVWLSSYKSVENSVGYATFTCTAHYE